MNSYPKRLIQAGFTLVELLIVVIILAVLAAIIVPQFSSATIDAQEAALDANLARVRSAIELYQAQHASAYPGANASTGGTCSGGTAGSGAAGTNQAFMDQLLMYSDASGKTCTVGDTTFKYGPYLRKGVPHDSITGKGSVVADIVVTTTGAPITPSAATGGWAYDTKSGQIVMNSNANDTRGKVYSSH
jgi:prepilin-type N-terminal cleavage/methylation domain-containing protein